MVSVPQIAPHESNRAASSAPHAALGGRQAILRARTSLDLGARYRFTAGKVPVSARFIVENIFDNASWYVVASNSLRPAERRSWSLYLVADF